MFEIPTIIEFLEFFDFLRGYPAAYLIMLTAALILIVRDWRWSLLFLILQYLLAVFLLDMPNCTASCGGRASRATSTW